MALDPDVAPGDTAGHDAPDAAEHPTVEVAAGVIRDDRGRFLITRRRAGAHLAGLWEFPGGKRAENESLEACLSRELLEELGATVGAIERLETVRWQYPDKTVVLHFFRCRVEEGAVTAREGQELEWVSRDRLAAYDFPEADAALIRRLCAGLD